MPRQPASTVRITKTRSGTRIRATGGAAQELFDAMCKAHGLQNPMESEQQQTSEEEAREPVVTSLAKD